VTSALSPCAKAWIALTQLDHRHAGLDLAVRRLFGLGATEESERRILVLELQRGPGRAQQDRDAARAAGQVAKRRVEIGERGRGKCLDNGLRPDRRAGQQQGGRCHRTCQESGPQS
jgi:hypothetical protein